MKLLKKIIQRKEKRKKRTRAKISGNIFRPRLSVFRSNKHIYGQLIDDEKGVTLVSASDVEIKNSLIRKDSSPRKGKLSRMEIAFEVGSLLANRAKKKKIRRVVFDKGCYKFHGRVAALADGARKGGLDF